MTRKPKRRGKTKRKGHRAPLFLDMRGVLKRSHRPSASQLHKVSLPADGIARNYGELVAMLVARRVSIGLSQERLDEVAGMQPGYSGKLENPTHPLSGRAAVNASFDLWLGGLDIGIAIVPLNTPAAARKRQSMSLPTDRLIDTTTDGALPPS